MKKYSLALTKKQLILLSDFIDAGLQFVDGCDLIDLASSSGYSDLLSLKSIVDDILSH